MSLPHMHVLSTGLRSPFRARCEASVASQKGVSFTHHYVEAGDQTPPLTKIENLLATVAPLEPDSVCVALDGDDWFATDRALEIVAKAHANGAWLTAGSFQYADGRMGFAAPPKSDNYRREPWTLTHTKSWRSGLMHRIRHEDLKYNGAWIDRGDDPAWIWPMAEMAGPDRIAFLSTVTYVYNLAASFEWSATQAELAHERAIVAHVRGLKPYERIEAL